MVEVICERLDDFGRGIGYVDGKIIFVSGLLPGEKAKVEIVSSRKKYLIGKVLDLENRSKDRICGKCCYEKCGCALKNLSYAKTLEYKKEKVQSILKRFGGIDISISKIIPSSNIYGYRNKITLKVKNGKIGYFQNDSNDLIEIDKCLIARGKINDIINLLKKEDLSKVSEVVIKDMDEVMISINGNMNIENLKNCTDSIFMNGVLLYGKEKIFNHILNYKYLVSKDSFFQINDCITDKLYSKILEYARGGKKVIDLFCGTGTISIFLSDYFNEVVGVEINKEAVECANENKKINGISNVSFMCGDANKLVKGLKADVIVVDPARSGLTKDGVDNILNIGADKVIYVSCDPITFARDLKYLSKLYDVKEITLFDMFPWTYHVECVTLLNLKTLEK